MVSNSAKFSPTEPSPTMQSTGCFLLPDLAAPAQPFLLLRARATLALEAGRSVRWVADQLGHADPALTLRVYAHVLPSEESDLSFADFEAPGRPYAAPDSPARVGPGAALSNSAKDASGLLARREGLEPPTLRFEA